MAQIANADDLTTGTDAFDHVRDVWQDVGLGMVEAEYHEPYLIISRAGADWTLFLPVTDAEAVLLPHDAVSGGPTTRALPKDLRADNDVPEETERKLARAFNNDSGGMFPLEGGFGMAFIEENDGDRDRYQLVISHTDGEVTIEDQ